MPLLLNKNHGDFSLFIWEIKESESEFKDLVSLEDYDAIINNVKLRKRKLEKLSQLCLQDEAKIENKDLIYLSNGKPILNEQKHVSFSHSGELSALLLGGNNCGLDLELPSEKILRIQSKFINSKEKKVIISNEDIYWAWSIKEAIFKYFGERVLFKEHMEIQEINLVTHQALVNYQGFHGKGQFELELLRFKNAYLAFTKQYRSS